MREPVEHIKLWMQVYERYRTVECKREQLKLAWIRALPRFVHKGVNWSNVGGPLTATIATIAEQGWKPIAPGHWRTPDETMEAVLNGEKSDNLSIAAAFEQTCMINVWNAASKHYMGKGLERGVPSFDKGHEMERSSRSRCCGGRGQLARRT